MTPPRPFDFHDAEIDWLDPPARRFSIRLLRDPNEVCGSDWLIQGRIVVDRAFVHTGIVLGAAPP